MDERLTFSNGLLYQGNDAADHRFNNVCLSLLVKRGSFFFNPEFGSRLHLLRRGKCTVETEAKIKDYCQEALQWLVTSERVKSVQVQTERQPVAGRISYICTVTWADNTVITYDNFVGVV